MPQKHNLPISHWAKRAIALSLLLCLSVSAAWSQMTQLAVTGTTVDSYKVYDGNYLSHVNTLGTLIGVADTDQVVLAAYAHYCDPNVGTNKTVFVDYTISGPDAHKYLTPAGDTLHADIIGRRLGIEGVVIEPKSYNNTTSVTFSSLGNLTGILPADQGHVFHSMYGALVSPAANPHAPVVVNYVLYGTATANYLAPLPDTLYTPVMPRPLNVSGVQVATNKVYDGTTFCAVTDNGQLDATGILDSDEVTYSVSARYASPNANLMTVTPIILSFNSSNSNYELFDTEDTLYATISPLTLTLTTPEVVTVKEYDGTNAATVVTPAVPTNLIGSDQVELTTTAYFDDANAGHGKQVFAHFTLGTFGGNYTTPADVLISEEGRILLPTLLDTLNLATGEVITAQAEGFCHGNEVVLSYRVSQGEPTMFRLAFNDDAMGQGFVNTGWRLRNAEDSVITIAVPENCQPGRYAVDIFFINDAEVMTDGYTCHFNINFRREYLVQVFDDVLSIDNSGRLDGQPNRFKTYQWYHNGETINETKPYHQELGGLTGEYYVRVNANTETEALICPWDESMRVNTVMAKTINVFPTPVVSSTQIKLQGFDENEHLLRIFNSFGAQVFEGTFNGRTYNLDMSLLPQGTYMINVDGATAKTIKL